MGNILGYDLPIDRSPELRRLLIPEIEKDLSRDGAPAARAAYLALCLGESERLRKERPEDWARAIAALQGFPGVLKNLFEAPRPFAKALQERAASAGLQKR